LKICSTNSEKGRFIIFNRIRKEEDHYEKVIGSFEKVIGKEPMTEISLQKTTPEMYFAGFLSVSEKYLCLLMLIKIRTFCMICMERCFCYFETVEN